MGVDFYACTACSRTFPDCGDFEICSEDENGCGARYCSAKCARIEEPEIDPGEIDWEEFEALTDEEQKPYRTTCVDCRGDLESAENLLAFALGEMQVSRDEFIAKYRASRSTTNPPHSGAQEG